MDIMLRLAAKSIVTIVGISLLLLFGGLIVARLLMRANASEAKGGVRAWQFAALLAAGVALIAWGSQP